MTAHLRALCTRRNAKRVGLFVVLPCLVALLLAELLALWMAFLLIGAVVDLLVALHRLLELIPQ